jgi:hypothetical protein
MPITKSDKIQVPLHCLLLIRTLNGLGSPAASLLVLYLPTAYLHRGLLDLHVHRRLRAKILQLVPLKSRVRKLWHGKAITTSWYCG